MSSVKSFISTGHFTWHKPVNCTMYTETDVSGSVLSECEKSAEKWQLGTAISVCGTGELMKFVIKTFLYSAKYHYSCCSRKQKYDLRQKQQQEQTYKKGYLYAIHDSYSYICYFNTGECLVTETRCCSTNGYRGEQQRSALTADVIKLRHISDRMSIRERLYSRQLCKHTCVEVRLSCMVQVLRRTSVVETARYQSPIDFCAATYETETSLK
jgi:hypothetical protein